jgi:hypothetical protein
MRLASICEETPTSRASEARSWGLRVRYASASWRSDHHCRRVRAIPTAAPVSLAWQPSSGDRRRATLTWRNPQGADSGRGYIGIQPLNASCGADIAPDNQRCGLETRALLKLAVCPQRAIETPIVSGVAAHCLQPGNRTTAAMKELTDPIPRNIGTSSVQIHASSMVSSRMNGVTSAAFLAGARQQMLLR